MCLALGYLGERRDMCEGSPHSCGGQREPHVSWLQEGGSIQEGHAQHGLLFCRDAGLALQLARPAPEADQPKHVRHIHLLQALTSQNLCIKSYPPLRIGAHVIVMFPGTGAQHTTRKLASQLLMPSQNITCLCKLFQQVPFICHNADRLP